MRRRKLAMLPVLAVALSSLAAWHFWPVSIDSESHRSGGAAGTWQSRAAHFVGSEACQDCHAAAYQRWTHSDHAAAMAKASGRNVQGDFGVGETVLAGQPVQFLDQQGEFFVRLIDADGEATRFKLQYTFGTEPLQQYLVQFPDGRLQVLPFAWDSRAADRGGQRWFVPQPAALTPDHLLYWQGPAFNWNRRCADCHSTGLVQAYNAETGHYRARWSDIGVGCEACHGPASRHLAWARHPADLPNKGLVFNLDGASRADWIFAVGEAIAHRQPAGVDRTEVQTCGRCHSRRMKITRDYAFGQPLADSYRVALLTEDLYFPDGQQKGEVYEYGSFLQSRMYAAGVTCSNCHEPHTGALRAQGNALCTRCHRASVFATRDHHHHEPGSAASLCVNCHMPPRTYMQVDARRDHSFRIPRPDLSDTLGTPNACTGCHRKRGADWAARQIAKTKPGEPFPLHYEEALWRGRNWAAGAPA